MCVCVFVVVTAVVCSASGIDDLSLDVFFFFWRPLRFVHLDGTGRGGGAREGKFNVATGDRFFSHSPGPLNARRGAM